LEKDRSLRYQHAADIRIDLQRLRRDFEATVHEKKTKESSKLPDEVTNELVERQFMLTERVCQKLDRAALDPRIIGDHLLYVDNQLDSDVLVFFLHGLGLDHSVFRPILQRLRYRGVSPTVYGWEPERRGRISLSLADHVVILRELLRDAKTRFHAETVVMVGFSVGADMGFDLLLGPTDEPTTPIDAFLSLECNLSVDTCFISRLLAGIVPDDPVASIAKLRAWGDSAASLNIG
jgi:pimeloyl-ACP methyl ester carboxylesterase